MASILVCDDDKEIVDAIEIYLMQEGYQVYKAYDGEQALKVLKEKEIHLLIIDVMMPKLDGIHATLKIREYSSIPIIILSAKSEDTDKILGLNIGADDYVTKPFNPLELVARVKSNLRRYTTLGNLNVENNFFLFYSWYQMNQFPTHNCTCLLIDWLMFRFHILNPIFCLCQPGQILKDFSRILIQNFDYCYIILSPISSFFSLIL